jgi:hypothetical protein
MLAKVQTCAVIGLEGSLVQVEADIGRGLPAFAIVGLPDVAVNEAKERVRSAIRNSGGTFPIRRITVNLAPADLCILCGYMSVSQPCKPILSRIVACETFSHSIEILQTYTWLPFLPFMYDGLRFGLSLTLSEPGSLWLKNRLLMRCLQLVL